MGNPHIVRAEHNLEQAGRTAYQGAAEAFKETAGVHAQLAIAYELNTIGRILAHQAEIITPADPAMLTTGAAADQHDTILSRLGL